MSDAGSIITDAVADVVRASTGGAATDPASYVETALSSILNKDNPFLGGLMIFAIYSTCLIVCFPTSPIEFSAIFVFGWYAFPFCIAAKYFVLLCIVPFVFSGKCRCSRFILNVVETGTSKYDILQFFRSEVEQFPLRTAFLIRMMTIPVSLQNYFLYSVGCPMKYSFLALTVGSIPLTAAHFYGMITVKNLMAGDSIEHDPIVYSIARIMMVLGVSVIPGYFIKRYRDHCVEKRRLKDELPMALRLRVDSVPTTGGGFDSTGPLHLNETNIDHVTMDDLNDILSQHSRELTPEEQRPGMLRRSQSVEALVNRKDDDMTVDIYALERGTMFANEKL